MLSKLCKNIKSSSLSKVAICTLALVSGTSSGVFVAYAENVSTSNSINDTTEVRLVINGRGYTYTTMKKTVEEVLRQENFLVHEKDTLNQELNAPLEDGMIIYLNTAKNINFVLGDQVIEFKTSQPTIERAIEEFCQEHDITISLIDTTQSKVILYENMNIDVFRSIEVTKTVTEEVPFATVYSENSDLEEGQEIVLTEGQVGSKDVTIKQAYDGMVLVNEREVGEFVTIEPITRVVQRGIKVSEESTDESTTELTTESTTQVTTIETTTETTTESTTQATTQVTTQATTIATTQAVQPVASNSSNTIQTDKGTFVISNKINMRSSAYTAGAESTGKNPGDAYYGITASGMVAQRGVVAVDTSVIPFGTELYIEGYGYAIAGDTGGAIKGNKIDVFLDSYAEAIKYGVKNVDVYILGDKIN